MRKLLKHKKGVALGDIGPLVLMLVILGFIAGLGVLIFTQMSTFVDTQASNAIVNESSTTSVTYATGYVLQNNSHGECSITNVLIINGTTGGHAQIIPSTNYTVTGCWIKGTNAANEWNGSDPWKISGTTTFRADNKASVSMKNTSNATGDLVSWLPIVVVILAMAILLGIVLNRFTGNSGPS